MVSLPLPCVGSFLARRVRDGQCCNKLVIAAQTAQGCRALSQCVQQLRVLPSFAAGPCVHPLKECPACADADTKAARMVAADRPGGHHARHVSTAAIIVDGDRTALARARGRRPAAGAGVRCHRCAGRCGRGSRRRADGRGSGCRAVVRDGCRAYQAQSRSDKHRFHQRVASL